MTTKHIRITRSITVNQPSPQLIKKRIQTIWDTLRDQKVELILVYSMAAAYILVMFTLMVLKHNAFNTRVNDFARFSQAIWNTLDGQFLYTSLSERSILGDHFSPIMGLFAPLLWVWPNERVLFLVQTINIAATGLVFYHLARAKQPKIAIVVALLFFLNPAVHEITLFELRRIVFGMPWLALGLYGLVQNNKRLMLFGLLVALLSKESVAIYVLMFGIYLIVMKRDWRWGAGLIVLGAGWSIIVGAYVIPAFNPSTEAYPQLYYYSHLGDSYGDLVRLGLTDPIRMIQAMFGDAQFRAIFRILLPIGFIALLDFPLLLTTVPYLALMFLSQDIDMFNLDKWYTATITPVLFAALITGWQAIPKKIENFAIGWVITTAIIAFGIYSYAPLGGRFDVTLYQPSQRDRVADIMTHQIPENMAIMSHPLYIPHLTHINQIYHYDSTHPNNQHDYILIDNQVQFQPFGPFEIRDEVANLVADAENVIAEEADGIYLIGVNQRQLLAHDIDKTAKNSIHLDRMEFAVADQDGFYQNTIDSAPTVRPGETVRITLYWEALEGDIVDHSVSTRISAHDGFLLTQQDQMPAANYRPMSWWDKGEKVRDVYYLTIPEGTAAQLGSIDLVLYDSLTQENIHFAGEDEILALLPLIIVSS
ncbi:MAG: DUF2079 domain-containing protein [Anaerolineae bacterium]